MQSEELKEGRWHESIESETGGRDSGHENRA